MLKIIDDNLDEIKSKMPKGYSEQEFIEIVTRIGRKLSRKFRFGYYGVDDMEQEAFCYALEALDRYDGKRPLSSFLWSHCKNRLFNLKRNKFCRIDLPCKVCPLYDPDLKDSDNQCIGFADKMECTKYNGWITRNTSKANLMCPIDLSDVDDEFEENMRTYDPILDNITTKEVVKLIDKELSIDLRSTYLKIKNGVRVNKKDMEKFRDKAKELIFDKLGLFVEDLEENKSLEESEVIYDD